MLEMEVGTEPLYMSDCAVEDAWGDVWETGA